MKRKLLLCSLAVTLLLSGGCGGQPAKLEYIGADSAKAAAVEAAGLQAGQVSFSSVDMSTREGLDYYHVEFTADGQTYRYDIDALTGTVIEAQVAPNGAAVPSTDITPSGGQQVQAPEGSLVTDADTYGPGTQQPPAQSSQETPGNVGGESKAISVEEAKAIALAQVPGATLDDIWEFEVDYDDGRLEYEGKIYYDHMEYEFEIDGYSGAIRSWDVDSIYD